MILFPLAFYRSRLSGAAGQDSTHAAVLSSLTVSHTTRDRMRLQPPASPAPWLTPRRFESIKEVSPIYRVSVAESGDRRDSVPVTYVHRLPTADRANQRRRGDVQRASAPPVSIVRPVVEMRIPAPQEIPAVPAESGFNQLQEELDEMEVRLLSIRAYVAEAAADERFTPEELAGFHALSNGALVMQQEARRTAGFAADAIGLAKTLLHTAAITPWTARQARERSEDRLRLLETPVNVIPFRRPDDIRVS